MSLKQSVLSVKKGRFRLTCTGLCFVCIMSKQTKKKPKQHNPPPLLVPSIFWFLERQKRNLGIPILKVEFSTRKMVRITLTVNILFYFYILFITLFSMSFLRSVIDEHETTHKSGHQILMAIAICYCNSVHLQWRKPSTVCYDCLWVLKSN